jgi:hypothetical protein
MEEEQDKLLELIKNKENEEQVNPIQIIFNKDLFLNKLNEIESFKYLSERLHKESLLKCLNINENAINDDFINNFDFVKAEFLLNSYKRLSEFFGFKYENGNKIGVYIFTEDYIEFSLGVHLPRMINNWHLKKMSHLICEHILCLHITKGIKIYKVENISFIESSSSFLHISSNYNSSKSYCLGDNFISIVNSIFKTGNKVDKNDLGKYTQFVDEIVPYFSNTISGSDGSIYSNNIHSEFYLEENRNNIRNIIFSIEKIVSCIISKNIENKNLKIEDYEYTLEDQEYLKNIFEEVIEENNYLCDEENNHLTEDTINSLYLEQTEADSNFYFTVKNYESKFDLINSNRDTSSKKYTILTKSDFFYKLLNAAYKNNPNTDPMYLEDNINPFLFHEIDDYIFYNYINRVKDFLQDATDDKKNPFIHIPYFILKDNHFKKTLSNHLINQKIKKLNQTQKIYLKIKNLI